MSGKGELARKSELPEKRGLARRGEFAKSNGPVVREGPAGDSSMGETKLV